MALKLRSLSFIYLLLNHIHSMLQEPHHVTVDSGTLRGCAEVGMERWCDDVFGDISANSKIESCNSYIIWEMLRSIDITLCWPKKPRFLWDFSSICVKAFFSVAAVGFLLHYFRLKKMWLTWENKLSNVPL